MQVAGGLGAAPRQEVTVSPGAPFEMRLGWECSREPRQLGDVTFSSPCEFTSSRGGDLDCPLLPCQQGPRTAQTVLPCYGNCTDSVAILGSELYPDMNLAFEEE